MRLVPPEAPAGLPQSYIAVGAGSPVRPKGPVVSIDAAQPQGTQHALLARATGLIAPWSGLALLGVLSGVPTVALRSADTAEPDLDLAARVAGKLRVSLTILDASGLNAFTTALG